MTDREVTMKSVLKKTIDLMAALLVAPATLAYRVGACLMGSDRVFGGWSELFSLLPGIPGVYLRRAFYRQVLPECGEGTYIGFGTTFSHPTARIGDRVYIGNFCSLGDVKLEEDVLVASHVSIINGGKQHGIDRLDIPIREQPGCFTPVTIGHDSWIGERATVAADMGKHSVVGAGAVVTKSIPDRAVAVGVPAKVVRFRDEREQSEPTASLEQAEELLRAAT
jgi:virginiamycin A acetyltransferase